MYCVYLVECKNKKSGKITYYCGYTSDIKRRAWQHKTGNLGARYTKGRDVLSVRVIKEFRKRGSAMKYERKVKCFNREKKIKLFNNAKRIILPFS
ncbi:MAG: GIY-YIG nuclease family protein [Candidatus Lokiarchaeota archaeon]|nr:GIY-YIG nuclease family protein [Candidatus Lokiarchaeota archaeon]